MSEQCAATLLQKDDRWGGFVLQCDLVEGHDPNGEHHEHAMTGCEPVARLVWRGTYEPAAEETTDE